MPSTSITHGRVTWTNVYQPTPADIVELSRRFPQFHPLNLQDCLTAREIPKLDHFDDYIFLVVHLPVRDNQEGSFYPAEVDIFITHGVLITAHRCDLVPLNRLFGLAESDEQQRASLMAGGASPLLHRLLAELVDASFPLLEQALAELRHTEANLFSDNTHHLLREIAKTRRNVIAMKHILFPQQDVVRQLSQGNWEFIHEDLDQYWNDILDHLTQQCQILEESSEVITGLSETADSLASHRIDEMVRLLTLVSVVTLPLTLLATVFGMNITLPYSQHPASFFVIIGSGLAFVVLMLVYIQRNHWF